MTTLVYADDRTRITLDGGLLVAWHANPNRRTDTARVTDPADVSRFARWNLPPGVSRFDFQERLDALSPAA